MSFEDVSRAAARDEDTDEYADNEHKSADCERLREPAFARDASHADRACQQRGCGRSTEGAADRASDTVHPGSNARLTWTDVLDDQVRGSRECQTDARTHNDHREIDLPTGAVSKCEQQKRHDTDRRPHQQRHLGAEATFEAT